jgi:hypothetical protein
MTSQTNNNSNVTGANSKKNYSIGKQCSGIGDTDSSESGSEDGKTPQQVIHSKRQISSKIIEGTSRKAAKTSKKIAKKSSGGCVSRSICEKIVDQGRESNGTTTMTSSISTNRSLSLQDVEVQVIVDRNSQLYEEHLKTAGYLQEETSLKANLKTYVTLTLFSKCKFITCESQLDRGGRIAEKLMNTMKVALNHRDCFWEKNRSSINNILRVKRNNVMVQLKEGFFRK